METMDGAALGIGMDAPIGKPMPQQVSALNTAWVIHYLQAHYPGLNVAAMVEAIHNPIPYYVINLHTHESEKLTVSHLVDTRYWFSNLFMMDFYKAIETRIPEPRLGYTIGRAAHLSNPIRRAAIVAPLIGPKRLLKSIVKESKKYNRTKETYLLSSSRDCTVIRLVHKDGIKMVDFGMDWHAGVFHAYATLAGASKIEVRWHKQDQDFKVVDFEVTHRYPGLISLLLRRLIFCIPTVKEALSKAEEIQEEHRQTILSQENIIQARTEQIQTMQQQLLSQERMMTEAYIAGGMAHEIRNCLGAARLRIRQMTKVFPGDGIDPSLEPLMDCLQRPNGLADEDRKAVVLALRSLHDQRMHARHAIAEIDRAVQRGLTVAGRVMDYAMLNQADEHQEIDLGDIAAELAETYNEDWALRGIDFTLNIPAENTLQTVVPNQFHSVLQNLLLNARDAIIETGRGHGQICLRISVKDSETMVEVSDNGIGIPEEHRDKLFQPFFSTKPHAGMGLGLSACRKIIDSHNGRIEMQSVVGEGSVFRVILPGSFDAKHETGH